MRFSPAKRKEIEDRAKNSCEYCKCSQEFSPQPFSVEHIIPKSKKGTDKSGNLALACQACNNTKYNKTHGFDSLTQHNIPLYHPRKDIWEEHFA